MNHPTEDDLLLLAYGELPERRAAEVEVHTAGCSACQGALEKLERGRVALDLAGSPRRRTARVWATLTLAAAAVLAGVLLSTWRPSDGGIEGWTPTSTWSATAGYVGGGKPMIDIDAQLTRLERERYYGVPN